MIEAYKKDVERRKGQAPSLLFNSGCTQVAFLRFADVMCWLHYFGKGEEPEIFMRIPYTPSFVYIAAGVASHSKRHGERAHFRF